MDSGNSSTVGKSSTGMDANIAAGISVVFGWISGLIFLLIERDSAFVKFYAIQSIFISLLSIFMWVVVFFVSMLPLPGMGFMRATLTSVLGMLPFILWVVLLLNAFQGRVWRLPLVGEFARRQAGLI